MQYNVNHVKNPIHAQITLQGSKQLTFRALLLAALADGVSEISGLYLAPSTRLFIKALQQLGIVTQLDEKSHSCIIAGGNGKFPKKQATLQCGNNAQLARLLLVACASTSGVYYFDGKKSLRDHPYTSLINLLTCQGAQILPHHKRKIPLTLIGADTLEGGEIPLNEKMKTQAFSALLMIAPYARSPFILNLSDKLDEQALELTCSVMAEFGVLVQHIHQTQWLVPVPQRYQALDYSIEFDFSLAAYFLAAAAITGGEIIIKHAPRFESKQKEARILNLLEKMGCFIQENHPRGLLLRGPKILKGIEIPIKKFSNIYIILAAIAPFAKSATTISNLKILSPRELTLFNLVKQQLLKNGIHIESTTDSIKIFPGQYRANIIDNKHDAVIGMAFSIVGLKVPGIVIQHPEYIFKKYPQFFNLLEKITHLSATVM